MPKRSGRSRAASASPGVGLVRALEWNHRAIKCVAFDPTLRQLAGGGLDGTVALWDTIEGKLVRTFERRRSPFEWQCNEIASVAFDAAGRVLAGGGVNGAVNVWDTGTGALIHTLPSQGGPIGSLGFHPTENILASGSAYGSVNVWDTTDGKLLRTFRGTRGEVVSVVFDPTGRLLARGSVDGTSYYGIRQTAHCAVFSRGIEAPSPVSVSSRPDGCWQSAASTIPSNSGMSPTASCAAFWKAIADLSSR